MDHIERMNKMDIQKWRSLCERQKFTPVSYGSMVETFIREKSPNRLLLVTNAYKREGDLPKKTEG